jgi:putative nucleotidyltransferase with HDIG domain
MAESYVMAQQDAGADAAGIKPPEGLCKLPQFRPVALKLLKLLCDDDISFSDVGKVVSSDPAFSAELLAMANSPLYATRCEISSLTRAIVVLGLERTRSVTYTVALQAFLTNVQVTPELQNSWRHSLASALIAEELAPAYGIPPDRGYTAGLLHDLGRLGLLKAYAQRYAAVLNGTYDSVTDVLDAERALFQVDHCQAGLWLTRSWGFPEEFQAITAHHHACRYTREEGALGVAGAACLLADTLGFQSVRYTLTGEAPDLANLDLEAMRGRILDRMQAVDMGV